VPIRACFPPCVNKSLGRPRLSPTSFTRRGLQSEAVSDLGRFFRWPRAIFQIPHVLESFSPTSRSHCIWSWHHHLTTLSPSARDRTLQLAPFCAFQCQLPEVQLFLLHTGEIHRSAKKLKTRRLEDCYPLRLIGAPFVQLYALSPAAQSLHMDTGSPDSMNIKPAPK